LSVLAWRYKDSAWEPAPDSVSVHLDADGAVLVQGHAEGEPDRWAENENSGAAYPIRVTVAVEEEYRLTSASAVTDKPTGWPDLESVLDGQAYKYEARKKAYLPVDADDEPVMDDPDNTEILAPSSATEIASDQTGLTKAAKRTLLAASRPSLSGSIRVYALNWDLESGQFITSLTGGGSRPTLTINAVVQSITYDMTEGQESMTLTLGGGTTV
jgi:hypothetical protein